MRLPISIDLRLDRFTPEIFDQLAKEKYCFFLDSSLNNQGSSRFSYFGINPVSIFSSKGGYITIDGHTFIDDPVKALKRFELTLYNLPKDPYLPFSGGLVGFLGHGWPNGVIKDDVLNIPDSWFGLFDTIVTYDHLEKRLWVSSMGLNNKLEGDEKRATEKCETIISLLSQVKNRGDDSYLIKTLLPEPVSNFDEGRYISTIDIAKKNIQKKIWDRVNLAQRFYVPVESSSWSMHKYLSQKNPTPYASYLKCGYFELSSTSPSGFLKIEGNDIECNVVQKSLFKDKNEIADRLNRKAVIADAKSNDPIVKGDETSLELVLKGLPKIQHPHIESDARNHYLVNKICGIKSNSCQTADVLSAAMPGASMTGAPKYEVNGWLKKNEPSERLVYTGTIGYIGADGNAQFNMAVRTMIVKENLAFVHAGQPVDELTEGEESYCILHKRISQLFDELNTIKGDKE